MRETYEPLVAATGESLANMLAALPLGAAPLGGRTQWSRRPIPHGASHDLGGGIRFQHGTGWRERQPIRHGIVASVPQRFASACGPGSHSVRTPILPPFRLLRRWIIVVAISVGTASAASSRAVEPETSLAGLVPADVGLCVEVSDLAGGLEQFQGSELYRRRVRFSAAASISRRQRRGVHGARRRVTPPDGPCSARSAPAIARPALAGCGVAWRGRQSISARPSCVVDGMCGHRRGRERDDAAARGRTRRRTACRETDMAQQEDRLRHLPHRGQSGPAVVVHRGYRSARDRRDG